jgi:hypothetical protein
MQTPRHPCRPIANQQAAHYSPANTEATRDVGDGLLLGRPRCKHGVAVGSWVLQGCCGLRHPPPLAPSHARVGVAESGSKSPSRAFRLACAGGSIGSWCQPVQRAASAAKPACKEAVARHVDPRREVLRSSRCVRTPKGTLKSPSERLAPLGTCFAGAVVNSCALARMRSHFP